MDRIQIHLEYTLNATSKAILWTAISTPSGLMDWFADEVEYHGQRMTFHWGKDEQKSATILSMKPFSHIKWRWEDTPEGSDDYVMLQMTKSEITQQFTLEIFDFADDEEDADDLEDLWDTEVETLRRTCGF